MKKFLFITSGIILIIFLLSRIGLFSIAQTTESDPGLSHTTIDGYRFHTETFGNPDQTPLIVIHGGPGGDYQYLLNLKILSDSYHVIFYDQRGSGLSPRENPENYSIESFVEDLNGIVNYYSKGRKAILVGHSWGAMLATAYISKYPERVSRVVLMEPGMLDQESASEFLKKVREAQGKTSLNQIAMGSLIFLKSIFVQSVDGHEMKDYILTAMMGLGKGSPYQCEGESLPKGSFVRAGYSVFNKMIMPLIDHPENFAYNLASGVNAFHGKILMLSSECSFVGYEYQKKFHEKLFPKTAKHVRIDNTGHNMITLKPAESIKIIRDFLSAG